MTLEITSGTGQSSQNNVNVAEKKGQELNAVQIGLAVSSYLQDGDVNISKLLHAGEQNVPLFLFKTSQTNNAENVSIPKTNFWVKNGSNNIGQYRVMTQVTEQKLNAVVSSLTPEMIQMMGGEQVLAAVGAQIMANGAAQLGSDATLVGNEVRFSDLDKVYLPGGLTLDQPLLKGEEKISWLAGDVVDAGNMVGTTNLRSVITFIETIGEKSGQVTRYSGGYSTDFDGASDEITVNEISQFEVNDFIFVDADNDGLFTSNFADGNLGDVEINEAYPYCITAVNESTIELGLNPLLDPNDTSTFCQNTIPVNILGTETAGGPMTALAFTSESFGVQEVEPIISALTVGEGKQVSENELGVFGFTAQGARSLQLTQLQVEVSGSYNYGGGYGPRSFKLERANAAGQRTTPGATLGIISEYGATSPIANAEAEVVIPAGSTVLDLDENAVGFVAPQVGDYVRFPGDDNNGAGFLVTAVDGGNVTIYPALNAGQGIGQELTAIAGVAAYTGGLVESGTILEFSLVQPEEVSAGGTKHYVVLADTTQIRNNGADTSASTQIRILGKKGQVDNTNGLTWTYTRTNGNSAGSFTLSDSYIVTGPNLDY
jgi:hypothetical protein